MEFNITLGFNPEATRNDIKKRLIDTLADAVKRTAEQGKWSVALEELTKENSVEDISKMALQMAMKQMRGDAANTPEWFLSCIGAVKTIMAEDEMQGMECAAALYIATDRATAEQRLEAIQQLLYVIAPATTIGNYPGIAKLL